MNFNLTSYSTALFSTWINVEELNLLIDAGDGVTAGLMQKSRKIKHVFLTHPDRDHLTGLPQFVQLNSRKDCPILYYPKDSGSFPALQTFLTDFDPHVEQSQWEGIEDGQVVPIKSGYEMEALRNEHIKCPVGIHKSLSYKLFKVKSKLKQEFINLSQEEIKNIAISKGRDYLSEKVRKNVISFSGDTPVDDYEKWNNTEVLIHECTFLNLDDAKVEVRGNRHATSDEVMKMVSEIKLETLVLNHFSTRYNKEQIDSSIKKLIKEHKIDIPVHVIYPGEIKRDILNSNPLNA